MDPRVSREGLGVTIEGGKMSKTGEKRLPVERDWGGATFVHNSSVAPFSSFCYPRCYLRKESTGKRSYKMAHQQGPQAAWYNGQSVHELEQSVSVSCVRPAGVWAWRSLDNTNIGVLMVCMLS